MEVACGLKESKTIHPFAFRVRNFTINEFFLIFIKRTILQGTHALIGDGGERLEGAGEQQVVAAGQGEPAAPADVLPGRRQQRDQYPHQGRHGRCQVQNTI